MGSQEESWSERAHLIAKLETTLRMALVWGQIPMTFENGCHCGFVGEPVEEVVVVVDDIVVVGVDLEEVVMDKLVLEHD